MSEHPSAAALPYWSEYLQQVLRPRVESVLREHMGTWNDLVWDVVARAVVEDQDGSHKMTAEQIRSLLQDQLGMQLEVDVSVRFGGGSATGGASPGAGAAAAPEAGASRVEAGGHRDVIDPGEHDVRRRVNISPLAKAVGGMRRD